MEGVPPEASAPCRGPGSRQRQVPSQRCSCQTPEPGTPGGQRRARRTPMSGLQIRVQMSRWSALTGDKRFLLESAPWDTLAGTRSVLQEGMGQGLWERRRGRRGSPQRGPQTLRPWGKGQVDQEAELGPRRGLPGSPLTLPARPLPDGSVARGPGLTGRCARRSGSRTAGPSSGSRSARPAPRARRARRAPRRARRAARPRTTPV